MTVGIDMSVFLKVDINSLIKVVCLECFVCFGLLFVIVPSL